MKKVLLAALFGLFAIGTAQAVDLQQTDAGARWMPNPGMSGVFRSGTITGAHEITPFPIGPGVISIYISSFGTDAITHFGVAPRAGRLVDAFIVNFAAATSNSNAEHITISIGAPDVNTLGSYDPITSAYGFHINPITTVAGGIAGLNMRAETISCSGGSAKDNRANPCGFATEVSHGHPVAAATAGNIASPIRGGMLYLIIE